MLLIPLSLSLVFALLLFPFSRRLKKWRIPRSFASIVSLVFVLLLLGVTVYVLSVQIGRIGRELSAIEAKLTETIDRGQIFLPEQFDIAPGEQSTYIKQAARNFFQNSTSLYQTTFSLTAGFLNYLIIVPITFFFFLYYRSFLKEFFFRLTPRHQHDKLAIILYNI